MKLSDYIAKYLADLGIKHVFVVSGGASLHLIHSVASTPGIDFICTQHEQAGAMAAEAYARVSGCIGAAIATSGPGATNMITGICCAYYDSIPVIFITGQVATFRAKQDTGVRQIGFQETDIVNICKPITKYAVKMDDPQKIRYELEKAAYIAKNGRPGPVLIDIPDNIQREDIDLDSLVPFMPYRKAMKLKVKSEEVDKCIKLINNAKRPVIILGWGIRLAKADHEAIELISKLGFPVAPTWAMAGILPSSHPLMIGTFGTHGTRYANFAVQNADLILAIGTRLDTKATGSPMTVFAREAKKIVVDIDPAELGKFKKFKLRIDLPIKSDAKYFINLLNQKNIIKNDISSWTEQIAKWKKKFPICLPAYFKEKKVNPYAFSRILSESCKEDDILILDTGSTLVWMMQAFEFKKGQRAFHDWNNTAMGWALPASIGACFALKGKQIVCVTGDGALQMNIQELATVIRHKLPIKIFLVNNHGYSMIRQTQDQWMCSKYLASDIRGGLAFPDFEKVAKAYGFRVMTIKKNALLHKGIKRALNSKCPFFCIIDVHLRHKINPQIKFGRPNEDLEPLLDRKVFMREMLVKPIEVSLKD